MSEGRIALWRYRDNRRNYPGYHMTCDTVGGQWLEKELRAIAPGKSLTITLAAVTDDILAVPANWSPTVRFDVWHITSDRSARTLMFTESHPHCYLALPPDDVPDLLNGVTDILQGKGDYMIGENDQQELWFWWWPAANSAP